MLLSSLQFLWGLGLPAEEAECSDVYGLDEELLAMIPKPVLAVLFLYPLTSEVCPLFLWCIFMHCWNVCHLCKVTQFLGNVFICILSSYIDMLLTTQAFCLLQSEAERVKEDSIEKVSWRNLYLLPELFLS